MVSFRKTVSIKNPVFPIIIIVMISLSFTIFIQNAIVKRDIVCDKSKNVCNFYGKKMLKKEMELMKSFPISTVTGYYCDESVRVVEDSRRRNYSTRKRYEYTYFCGLSTSDFEQISIESFSSKSLADAQMNKLLHNIKKLPPNGEHLVYSH